MNRSSFSLAKFNLTNNDCAVRWNQHARKLAEKHNVELTLICAVAKDLPLPDNSYDAAVCTLTLCSAKSPEKAIQEIVRVLKPGGKFFFLEHVLAKNNAFKRALQCIVEPFHIFRGGDCCVIRDTEGSLRGYPLLSEVNVRRADIPRVRVATDHIEGVAIKAKEPL